MRTLTPALAVALAFAPAAASGQSMGPAPGGPSNIPSTYQPRQEFDTSSNPSQADQIQRKAQEASTDRAAAAARGGAKGPVPATPADLLPGSPVNDSRGKLVGTIDSVGLDGAIVATGTARVMVPLDAFGKSDKGLMLGITKKEFDAAAAAATAGAAK